MRLKLLVVALTGSFLLLVGLRPAAMPFVPEQRYSDAVTSHWPAALHMRQSVLESGTFPYWQDTILAGQPFAANPLNKTAYPLQWLVLLLPPALHLNVLILIHLLLAGWGMDRWLRRKGLTPEAALFGALAYALAPKLIAHTGAGHLDLVYAYAWWPWLMAAVLRLWSGRRRVIVEVALFAALLLLADVRLSLFAFLTAAVYSLWLNFQQQQTRRLWRIVPVAGLLVLLTLSLTLPLLTWGPYLSRGGLTVGDAGSFSLEPGHLIGVVLPPHSGNPETLTYLGLPVVLLAAIGLASAPHHHAVWGLLLAFFALYALGINGPLWPLLVQILPPLLWFRVPARAWFGVVLVAAVLAAHGMQALLTAVAQLRETGESGRLVIKRLALAGGMGTSLFCGGFTLAMLTDLPPTIGLGVLGIGLVLFGLLLVGFYGRIPPQTLAILVTLLLLADVMWTGRQWLEWRGPETWLTHQDDLVAVLQSDNPARIYSPNYALEQQVAAAHDLRLFYGVDPFQLSGIAQAIAQGSGVSLSGYSVVLPPLNLDEDLGPDDAMQAANIGAKPDTGLLAQWGVSHVLATYPMDDDRLQLQSETGDFFIYHNLDYAGGSLVVWPHAPDLPAPEFVESANRVTVAAALISGLALVLSLLLWRWL